MDESKRSTSKRRASRRDRAASRKPSHPRARAHPRRGRPARTPEEWGAFLLPEYETYYRATAQVKHDLDEATRRHCGVRLAEIRSGRSRRWRALWSELWRRFRVAGGPLPWWLRRLGSRRLVSALVVAPPYRLAVELLALKHGLSPHTVWDYIKTARRRRSVFPPRSGVLPL